MPVETVSGQLADRLPDYKLLRDIYAGERAVKRAGTAYLPALGPLNTPAETPEDRANYLAYVERALLYGALGRTVDGLSGMAFRKPPTITAPAGMDDLLADVTQDGRSIQGFAEDVVQELLLVGRAGILVDHPRVRGEGGAAGDGDGGENGGNVVRLTVAEVRRQSLRPYLQLYRAERVIDWREERRGGRVVLAHVRLHELDERQRPDDEFVTEPVERWRVLDLDEEGLYRQRVYEKVDGKTTLVDERRPVMNGVRPDFIPFEFVGPRGTGAAIEKPPLLDLAYVNISHYRTTADIESAVHRTGFPQLVITGYNKADPAEEFFIGSRKAWVLPPADADAKWLTYGGEGTQAAETRLARKEAMMASLGARMLAPEKRAPETAETENIRRLGETSALASLVLAAAAALMRALEWARDWQGLADEVRVKLNTDFMPRHLTGPELLALLKAWQGDGITWEDFHNALVEGEVVTTGKSADERRAEIEAQPPALGMIGVAEEEEGEDDEEAA